MRRILIYSHLDAPLGELSVNDVFSCIRREEINGEHSLEVTTTQVLEQGQRIVYQDGRGLWREYVVYGVDEDHSSGLTVVGTYYCVWSVQPDLQGVCVSKMPGVQSPVTAGYALSEALSEQTRWSVGTVTNSNTGGASMYDMSAWKAMGVLVGNWGGELGVTIQVSTVGGYVTSRAVDLYSQMGTQTARRRFDFGADLKSVKRKVADGPLYCRMSPRGKGAQTEGGGYGRKIRINDDDPTSPDYITYAPMVDVAKLPDGAGGYQYPTKIVENPDCETPEDLLSWAESAIAGELAPKVTYEVDVLQAAREGVDMQGVSLGDSVDLVDRKFRADGLRLTGRVVGITVDEVTGKNDSVTIGTAQESIASKFSDSGKAALEAVNALAGSLTTAAYIESLINRINADINATGGYTYIIPSNGLRTYDTAVSDPLVGSEASQVVEVKGGTIRIANSRTSGGEWDWKTVVQSGQLIADLVTSAAITSGYIGNSSNGTYWDLDSGTFTMRVANSNITSLKMDVMQYDEKIVSGSDYYYFRGLYESEHDLYGAPVDIGIGFADSRSTQNLSVPAIFTRAERLFIQATELGGLKFDIYNTRLWKTSRDGTREVSIVLDPTENIQSAPPIRMSIGGETFVGMYGSSSNKNVRLHGTTNLIVGGNLTVSGTKPRLVETENYADRLLYAYETPAPYFGDIGSATTDDEGVCVVSVDDVFAETARTDIAYQVFLQACGDGSVYVAEKTRMFFIVRGTPNLAFDWEVKAHQRDYELTRAECHSRTESMNEEEQYGEVESAYADDYALIDRLERIAYGYDEAA